MRTRISKISLIVFVVLLFLSGFLLSVAGDYWPWFVVMSVFASLPAVVGPRWYRIGGICGVVLSIVLIVSDWKAGVEFRQRLERHRSQSANVVMTNGEPDGAANRSQPIRAETNRTSAAAGSDR